MLVTTPLRCLREQRNKTLQEVADAINTDTGNLSRIEQGKQKSLVLATKLVDFYGKGAITESQILYPDRYPIKKRRQHSRKVRADVTGAAHG